MKIFSLTTRSHYRLAKRTFKIFLWSLLEDIKTQLKGMLYLFKRNREKERVKVRVRRKWYRLRRIRWTIK
jgi:hypothetical protein